MATRRGTDRYPRPGKRLAPLTLQEALLECAPRRLVRSFSRPHARFCDLDATVWEELPVEDIEALAKLVIQRVGNFCSRKSFRRRSIPRPPSTMKLADLQLEHRTLFCLTREGFDNSFETLGDCTIGTLLGFHSFGPRCLVDLLSSLENRLTQSGQLNEELTVEARLLASLPEASHVRNDDPRFAELLYQLDVEARSAKELAEKLVNRSQDPPDPEATIKQLRQLLEQIKNLPRLRLEEELIQIFVSTKNERNRQIVIGYYGWADGQQHTLAEIGNRYDLTRERTRQICAKMVKRSNPSGILAPVLDRTLACLAKQLPKPVDSLEADLSTHCLTEIPLRLECVTVAAELLGREIPFAIARVGNEKLVVPLDQIGLPPLAAEAAKKEVYCRGLGHVPQIESTLAEQFSGPVGKAIIHETLVLLPGFRWLDEANGWFQLDSIAKHGLPRAIDKILSVVSSLQVNTFRAALGRNNRIWQTPPPENVLLEYCRHIPRVRVKGEQILSDPPRLWQQMLTGVELQLVGALQEHGPVMERSELEEVCIAQGMNRFSFHAFLASSPVIAQYGHSVYGLLGADVSKQTIKRLVSNRRSKHMPTRVLEGHGQTDDGKVWLCYRLTKAASTYAVITVPAALKTTVCGRFKLMTPDGEQVGTLAAKDGRAWGMGSYLRKQVVENGNRVRITLDLPQRLAVISMEQLTK